jgi:thiol:disulfide interchange protein
MFKRFRIVAILALLLALVAIQYFRVPARPTIFTNASFEQAQAEAAAATPPKLLVVDFSASWCPSCRAMDRRTWTDPAVTDWLKQNAVTVKVDIDADKARARAFGIESIPTVIVLAGDQHITRIVGDTKPGPLLDKLKAAAPTPRPAPQPTPQPAPK